MDGPVAKTPLDRRGLSDQVSFVNGIDVLVDGGLIAAIRSARP